MGVYQSGQPLPSGRQLASEFRADRRTVARALEALREQGVVRQISPRIHVVNELAAEQRGQQLVGQAIAVVCLNGRARAWQRRQPGWVEHIANGALDAINEAGLHSLNFHPGRLREEGLGTLIASRPYGVIFSDFLTEPGENEMLAALHAAGIPFVVYGQMPSLSEYDRVSSDHEGGGHLLTRHLMERGRRKLMCFWKGGGAASWFVDRRRGHERALQEAGVSTRPIVTEPDLPGRVTDASAFEAAVRVVLGYLADQLVGPNAVDAILTSSDGSVPYVTAACRLLGRTPGEDIDIVGYDHYWADARERQYESTPPVATVDKQNAKIGRALVELLCQRVRGELPPEPQSRVIAPKLLTDPNSIAGLEPARADG